VSKVLIVEDDRAMRQLIRERLEDSYEIYEAGDAPSALGAALEHKPDCILLDLMLPSCSGFELCQTFSSLGATRLIPILVITGKPAAEYKEYCLNLGAADYFEKPLDFGRLRTCLDSVVDMKPTERRAEPRVRLNVTIKLAGTDMKGLEFSGMTATEDISPNGFLAPCGAPLSEGQEIDVFVIGEQERFAGRARVVRTEWRDEPWQRYGFRFLEKPRNWVLE
jgi:DNA-binding response OmpR family regulator